MVAPRRYRPLAVVLVCLGLLLLSGCGGGGGGGGVSVAATPDWARGMATVRADALPAQARETLRLIDDGGPFPYEKDGSAFGNFEGELPKQPRGHYREYTVRTPGESDRGARRLVTGRDGEIYYTDDHYQTFKAVLR
ncbi:ribonuclease domain-containing protein [Streptomyces cavernicola]|uniref:Ribonuclease domain-containing protein n=1 Tax=Streptomyces cavernicola TaxID=3043613 RepID=A0ABT6SEI6_9ACTN|nr:ribonuclease domain-containing protein [Streptomyces sp. B-S-A6]MDI3406602.1 ribonuclease domain-containing protein [Streptomyces sp. B-S-A6]